MEKILPQLLAKRLQQLMLILLICMGTVQSLAQNAAPDERSGLADFVAGYRNICAELKIESPVSVMTESFSTLFLDQHVSMPNDFRKGEARFPSPEEYIDDFYSFLGDNSQVSNVQLKISSWRETVYGKEDNLYYAWVYKTIEYTYENKPCSYKNWINLTIKWIDGGVGFRIIKVEKTGRPRDNDQDQIADANDRCLDSEPGSAININGCSPAPVIHNDPPVYLGRNEEKKENNKYNGTGSHEGTAEMRKEPRPPSSRFSLELTGGVTGPKFFHTSFSNRQLLDYETNTWKDSGALAYDAGFSLGLSVQYNLCRWLGMGIGYQGFYTNLIEKDLMLQAKSYLGKNGIVYDGVLVTSKGYYMHMIYGSLAIGNLRSIRHSFKFEPVIGQVYSDFILENKLSMDIIYPNKTVSQSLTLEPPPYLVYGGKFTFQWGFGDNGHVRFQLTAQYLEGKSDEPSQHLGFGNLPGQATITAPDLKWAAINAGFHFTLNKPRHFRSY